MTSTNAGTSNIANASLLLAAYAILVGAFQLHVGVRRDSATKFEFGAELAICAVLTLVFVLRLLYSKPSGLETAYSVGVLALLLYIGVKGPNASTISFDVLSGLGAVQIIGGFMLLGATTHAIVHHGHRR